MRTAKEMQPIESYFSLSLSDATVVKRRLSYLRRVKHNSAQVNLDLEIRLEAITIRIDALKRDQYKRSQQTADGDANPEQIDGSLSREGLLDLLTEEFQEVARLISERNRFLRDPNVTSASITVIDGCAEAIIPIWESILNEIKAFGRNNVLNTATGEKLLRDIENCHQSVGIASYDDIESAQQTFKKIDAVWTWQEKNGIVNGKTSAD